MAGHDRTPGDYPTRSRNAPVRGSSPLPGSKSAGERAFFMLADPDVIASCQHACQLVVRSKSQPIEVLAEVAAPGAASLSGYRSRHHQSAFGAIEGGTRT